MNAEAGLLMIAVTIAVITVARVRAARRRSTRCRTEVSGCQRPAETSTRRGRRWAFLLVTALFGIQTLMGAPAFAQDPFDCKQAPNPERPGSGMVGAIDPASIGIGAPGSVYDEVGYAGLVWHTYDLGCGPNSVTNPNATVDTWAGNQLFNLGKNLVGMTNGLHYSLLGGDLLKPLDDLIVTGTKALYDSVFAPWFGLAALVLAVYLFLHIWRGDLATISKRGMWALAGLWLASATYLTPLLYTHILDDLLIKGTSQAQAGFLKEVGIDERNALPTLLHDQVIYRNWLRGEFGSPDSPQAKELGRDLVRAQAWTKQEVAEGKDGGSPDAKKQAFQDIATKTGSAYGYFQGRDGSRVGAGFLAGLQGVAFASFQLMAKASILLAQILLRLLILTGPLIGLVAIVYHDLLRNVGRMVGAALLNVVILAVLAGLHTMILSWIFNPARGLSLLVQMLLAGLITLVFFLVGKPGRRMWQMVQLSVGTVGGAVPGAPVLFGRRRTNQPSAQDQFWDGVRDNDTDDTRVRAIESGRPRPEASVPVLATARRLDRPTPELDSPPAALPSGSSGSAVMLQSRSSAPAPSRVVDSPPVVDRSWDRVGEDAVVVPSRIGRPDRAIRRAETEVVGGRQVHVIYRPSRGLEVDGSGS